MIKNTCIFGIKLYQKFISPKKGYRCAHSVLHGDTGCSGAVIKIIENNSIFSWKNLISKRFEDCKLANIELKKDKKNGKCRKCKNNALGEGCDNCSDCGDCADIGDCSP